MWDAFAGRHVVARGCRRAGFKEFFPVGGGSDKHANIRRTVNNFPAGMLMMLIPNFNSQLPKPLLGAPGTGG
jgi:hypothetical protein